MLTNDQLAAWDREAFFHPSTHLAQHARGETVSRIMTGGEGIYVEDRDGTRLIDAFAGLYCVNVGYGRKVIADAIAEQAGKLAYYHAYVGHGTEASITLAHMILERAPQHMSKVYFGLSGSDANETNVKLVWYYNNVRGMPQKRKIISRWRGYHGSGLITGSLTGLKTFHNKFGLPLPEVIHTEAPYYYRRQDLSMSEAEFVAHCAAELGSMFGSDHYGIKPDIITIAKGLTSAYAPLSGSIVSDKVWKVLEEGTDQFGPIGHGWTYSAHPICAAAGVANLTLIDEMNLVQNAGAVGATFKQMLTDRIGQHPHVGEVRGEGLLCAVEFIDDKENRTYYDPARKIGPQVAAALLSDGVIARAMPEADVIGFAPPLCLTEDEAGMIADRMAKAVTNVLG